MRSNFRHFEAIAVRWADMDSMGHVNNAKYFTYCESARMAYFSAIHLQSHAEAPSHGPALVQAELNFRQQARYPDQLEVGTRVVQVSRKSFSFEVALFRSGTDEVVAAGSSVVAWIDYAAGRSVPLPESLKREIAEYEGWP